MTSDLQPCHLERKNHCEGQRRVTGHLCGARSWQCRNTQINEKCSRASRCCLLDGDGGVSFPILSYRLIGKKVLMPHTRARLSVRLSARLSVYLFAVCLSVCLSLGRSVSTVCVHVCLCFCLYVFRSVCLFLLVCVGLYASCCFMCLPIFIYMYVYGYMYRSICLSVRLPVCLNLVTLHLSCHYPLLDVPPHLFRPISLKRCAHLCGSSFCFSGYMLLCP